MEEQQLFQLGNGVTGFSCDGVAVGAWPISISGGFGIGGIMVS